MKTLIVIGVVLGMAFGVSAQDLGMTRMDAARAVLDYYGLAPPPPFKQVSFLSLVEALNSARKAD